VIKVLSAIFILSIGVFGSTKTNDYYNASFLGEKSFEHYFGPLDPSLNANAHKGINYFADDGYYNNFSQDSLESDFFDLNSFWNQDIQSMNSCPNFYLNKNINYIRYLYRLITISYLFESIKEHATLSYRLGYSEKTCSLDWNEVFGSCAPVSQDMKKFVRRTKPRYLIDYDSRKFTLMTRQNKKTWLRKTLPVQMKNSDEITYKRLARMCVGNNCKSLKSVGRVLNQSCNEDKKLLKLICSEKDHLYGVTMYEKATRLLAGSNVMRNLNKGGFASACLERYGELNKAKEVQYHNVTDLFPSLHKKLSDVSYGHKHIEGELFIPGALKEFDDRGLENFLFVKPKVIAKKTVVVEKVIVKKVEKPKPVVVAKKTIVIPKPVVKKIVKELSTFEKARKKLLDNDLAKLALEMRKFSEDFVFDERMIKAFNASLEDYQKISALRDMVMFDKLGTVHSPVRLIFLKFLIDLERHSGLWNVKTVLGNEFYVFNDIEKITKPVAVSLSNDASTNNEWQLTLLSENEYYKRVKLRKAGKKKGAKR
jgi:hypothetical protein